MSRAHLAVPQLGRLQSEKVPEVAKNPCRLALERPLDALANFVTADTLGQADPVFDTLDAGQLGDRTDSLRPLVRPVDPALERDHASAHGHFQVLARHLGSARSTLAADRARS